jgi:hypothetical protein
MNNSSNNSTKKRPVSHSIVSLTHATDILSQATDELDLSRPQKIVKLPVNFAAITTTTTTPHKGSPAAKTANKQVKNEKGEKKGVKGVPPPAHVPKEVNAVVSEPVVMRHFIPAATLLKGLSQLYKDENGMWHRKKKIVREGGDVTWLTEKEAEAAAALTSMVDSE